MQQSIQKTKRAKELRHQQTAAEGILWSVLRSKQLSGMKFRRQHPIGYYFADFACLQHKLIIELDGEYHDCVQDKDLERQEYLEQLGWKVLRFDNQSVIEDVESVMRAIVNQVGVEFSFCARDTMPIGMLRKMQGHGSEPHPAAETSDLPTGEDSIKNSKTAAGEVGVEVPGAPCGTSERQNGTRTGFTVVELLVVIGIISILIGLILPAVQAAREAARLTQCENNVRQLALAVLNHEASAQELPGGGWGYSWVGDATAGYGKKQPGGWIYQILGYLEQDALRAQGSSNDARAEMLAVPIPTLACPSRPVENPSPYLGEVALNNARLPAWAFRSDYAGNGGDVALRSESGPVDDLLSTLRMYRSPHVGKATGLFYQMSATKVRDIADGLSNTYLLGEKYIQVPQPTDSASRDFGHDQGALVGDDHDIRRWTAGRPRADRSIVNAEVFGSSHRSGWNAAMADGSVRTVAFGLDGTLHRHLGNRADGQSVEVPE